MLCRRGKENAESGNISSFQLACPRNHSTLGLVPDILYCIWYSVFRIRLDVTDKVGTTPNAGIAACYRSGHRRITNHGNSTSFLANNLLLSTVTVQVNQATLSLQIELISHMHIWGTERLRPRIDASYLSHHRSYDIKVVSRKPQRQLSLFTLRTEYSVWEWLL